ncbi:MAG TPA: hypothetical protein VF155_12530 [Candidatus Dormibacteraeota bacterium]
MVRPDADVERRVPIARFRALAGAFFCAGRFATRFAAAGARSAAAARRFSAAATSAASFSTARAATAAFWDAFLWAARVRATSLLSAFAPPGCFFDFFAVVRVAAVDAGLPAVPRVFFRTVQHSRDG